MDGGSGHGKKPAAFFSPSGMLKRGWSGLTSPIVVVKDTVYAAATPRSSVLTPTGASAAHSGASRLTLPGPAEYTSLFEVSAPSSTRSADGAPGYRQYGMGAISETEALRAPMSARASSSNAGSRTGSRRTASSSSSRTGSRDKSFFRGDEAGATGGGSVFFPGGTSADAMEEEEGRAYLAVNHHNLHSVLTNPKATNWGGALLDAFYPTLEAPDIPMIPFPGLQDVSARDFEPYLKKFGKTAKLYEDNHVKPVSEQLSSSNVPSVAVADEDVAKCLEVVPNMFFRPDYDFTDPAIFEEVMTMSTGSLQDELTTYLDRVEFTLLRQVSSRSDRFFEASANQEVMKQSIKVACDQVATLRKTMDRLRNGLADKTLDIVSLHRRQKRIAELHELVTLIESVKSAESAVEALVQIQDYTNALDLIDSSLATLHDHLQGIHGLNSLGEKFRGYRGFISSQISQKFISMITSSEWMYHEEDTHFDASTQSRVSSRQRRSSSTSSVGQGNEGVLVEDVQQLVDVLFRLDALNDAVATYRDRLNEEIKVVVKTVVTETIAVSDAATKTNEGADGGGGESKVSVQLRALTSDEFLQCVQMIFEHLLMILKRAVVVQEVLVKSMQAKIQEAAPHHSSADSSNGSTVTSPVGSDASSTNWTPTSNTSDESEALGDWKQKTRCNGVIREIDEVIRKTCEFSQRSVSNLFAVRKEVQAVYTMPQLRLLYDTTMAFVVSIEKLTGKTDYTLRGALFSQLKLFLEKYHQAQVAKLVSTLDHELWKNTEVAVTRHKALEDLSSGRGVPLTLSSDREIAGETAAPYKAVSICGKSFRVVWSVLLMLEIVMNYMSCAANFPVLATDVLQRSIEIFRLFNSRTTQLVLGAGAMQVARLKSISARHLALASQSLDLSMTLIPHIKAALAAHFTDRQKLLLDEFDRVLRDYAEHNEKIFSKFTSIVEDQMMRRFLENVAAEVDYDSSALAIPSKPMQGIAQSTLKLHAVLQPVLSAVQMRDVMTRVFDMFSQKLPECFKGVHPKTPAGKSRVVDDMAAFVQSFGDVKEVEFNGDALLRHFRTIYTPS